jgi:hypothetical protein
MKAVISTFDFSLNQYKFNKKKPIAINDSDHLTFFIPFSTPQSPDNFTPNPILFTPHPPKWGVKNIYGSQYPPDGGIGG